MKGTVVDEDGFELIDHNDAVHIEHSSTKQQQQQQQYMLSKKYSTSDDDDGGEIDHWNDRGRKKWTILLFFGCLLVYATRTSVSICAVPMGKELGWDKQLSVSRIIILYHIQTLYLFQIQFVLLFLKLRLDKPLLLDTYSKLN